MDDDLLELLLGAEVGGVAAGLLAAVGGPGMEAGIALAADHLQCNVGSNKFATANEMLS